MGVSTPSSFAGEGIVPLWPERQSIFVQPELDYRVGRRRVYRGYHHSSRSEPWSQAKRIFDVIGAGLGIVFFAPAFIAIAIAIKLTSPGPVLFSQRRYGYRNRRFRILQVPDHVHASRRWHWGSTNDPRRSENNGGRSHSSAYEPGRTPTAHQRDQRRHVTGRSAASRPGNVGWRFPLRRVGAVLFSAPRCPAGHHGARAGQRLSRKHFRRQDRDRAHRLRPRLHRHRVIMAGCKDHPADRRPGVSLG